MNMISATRYRPKLDISSLTRRQVDVLVIANSIVRAGNVIANMLVKCILIKTTQIGNNTFRIILLSVSDLMLRLFSQNLYTAVLNEINCIHMDTYTVIAVFLIS